MLFSRIAVSAIRLSSIFTLDSRLSAIIVRLSPIFLLAACSDYLTPVESTPAPNEYEYNYWLLQRTYLFEDELGSLKEDGESVKELYDALKDPYTRYVEPSKSEAAEIAINTTMVPGDVGMTYLLNMDAPYPLFVYRVYPKSPAGRADVPRYANIISINGVDLGGENALDTYNAVLDTSATIELVMVHDSTELTFSLTKETVYAPSVFVDTLLETIFISITGFKPNTADMDNGTYGELKAYLDSTKNVKEPRVIDIRGNPGGHVEQCVSMADLFVKSGTLSSRSWRSFAPDGKPTYHEKRVDAGKGDSGEKGKFIILADNHSASCSEIFAAAVTENADIPLVGTTTYGKGIGQTNWKTINGGLAIITNLEFLTPKGNSYHHKGLVPAYDCGESATINCAVEAIQKHFGTKASVAAKSAKPDGNIIYTAPKNHYDMGGAIMNNFIEEGN